MECHWQTKEGRKKSNEKRQKEEERGIEAEDRGQYGIQTEGQSGRRMELGIRNTRLEIQSKEAEAEKAAREMRYSDRQSGNGK
ncbi:hypothetical protein WR25_23110 [Diploscapter pachys]|uniref:Uncharacterized protein n=1 Tax=Diploscapter pachys TaxID=2018661 RepID=A0A2A2LQF2_9BILA|nr:hypothetical protein WR25_23110 [Diploscapter pachys]